MSALIGTWPRRLLLAIAVTVVTALVMVFLASGENSNVIGGGDVMKRMFILAGLLGAAVFFLSTAFVGHAAKTAQPTEESSQHAAAPDPKKPFVAQVVGLEWLNPLQRRDYPTEWQILWAMGLVGPNKNDDMVRTKPARYGSLQSILAIAYGNEGEETFFGFYKKYIDQLLLLYANDYVLNQKYFYTVAAKDPAKWRELAGIHIEFAGPERLDPVYAKNWLSSDVASTFNIGNPAFKDLWTKSTPPDVHITSGGPNAGFTSLNAALAYLQANPDKSVWVMNWDAPSFPPKDAQLNENLVLLILAGPEMKTERAPLAWIGKAATANVADYEPKAGTTRLNDAWKAAIATAAQNANVPASKVNYVIHDAGKGSDAASSRIGALGRTLTETLPEFDFHKQTFNMPALLGDTGAGTALTDVVLAIGRANHLGETVLVAGTTDAAHPVAVVVTPPEKVVPIDPNADWFRARGENNAYLPWWGRRYDEKYDGEQGYSW